jgi:hypothetical protein
VIESIIYEFQVDVPEEGAYTTPLRKGHWFFHGAHALPWMPNGQTYVDAAIAAASKASGKTLVADPLHPWWIVTLTDRITDEDRDPDTGFPLTVGDHNEGTHDGHWTLLVAMNELPDDAGAEFRLVDERGGNEVSDAYPHKRGRGLMFKAQHWHGNRPLNYPHDRVSLAFLVVEA